MRTATVQSHARRTASGAAVGHHGWGSYTRHAQPGLHRAGGGAGDRGAGVAAARCDVRGAGPGTAVGIPGFSAASLSTLHSPPSEAVFTIRALAPTGLSVVSRPLSGDTYVRGETIEVAVSFGDRVLVDVSQGRPTLALDGGERRRARRPTCGARARTGWCSPGRWDRTTRTRTASRWRRGRSSSAAGRLPGCTARRRCSRTVRSRRSRSTRWTERRRSSCRRRRSVRPSCRCRPTGR